MKTIRKGFPSNSFCFTHFCLKLQAMGNNCNSRQLSGKITLAIPLLLCVCVNTQVTVCVNVYVSVPVFQITLKSLWDGPKDSDQAGVCPCGVTLQHSEAEIECA